MGIPRVAPLVERGARFVGAPMWQQQLVVSERLVTGQSSASAAGVAEAMVGLLREEEGRSRTFSVPDGQYLLRMRQAAVR